MKTIKLTDLDRLKKLLGMLGSDQDGEVLNAARMVVKLLKENDLTWDAIFSRTVSATSFHAADHANPRGSMGGEFNGDDAVEEETMGTPIPMNSKIRRAFDELRGKPLGKFQDFITSIESFFETKGYLTKAQREALFDAVVRSRK